MSNGLKNILTHARAFARKERLESNQSLTGYDNDSGISGMGQTNTSIDDMAEHSCSSPSDSGLESEGNDALPDLEPAAPFQGPRRLSDIIYPSTLINSSGGGSLESKEDSRLGEALQTSASVTSSVSGQIKTGTALEGDALSCGQDTPSSCDHLGQSDSDTTAISYSFVRIAARPDCLSEVVLRWFKEWVSHQFRTCASGPCDGENSRSSGGIPRCSGVVADNDKPRGSGVSRGKRPAEDNSSDRDDSGNESRKDPKRSRPNNDAFGQRPFACPYFKRNPGRFKDQRTCPGPGFKSVHRVK